ncbi:TPR repeat region-containing protein [Mycolicibacterium sp. CBM1]
MSLAELDKWDPDAIHAVFSAVTDHSESTRLTSDGLGQVINAVPWEGKAHDAAVSANSDIRRDLNLHADELDAVAKAAKAAETEIRSIKSDWQHLQQEASAAGMTIDPVAGTVTYVRSSDPDEAAIQEHNYQVICEEVHRLLQRADQADADLAAAIDGADGHKSADEVNEQLSDHWVAPEDAEKVVHDALAGDKGAAARVNGVLDSITEAQQAGVPLTPEQGAVLSQLQAQEHGMSVDALQTAEQRLGDQKDMVGNSWQLMSNPKINFPKTELKPGAQTDLNSSVRGGFDQLPTSVQDALKQTTFSDGWLDHGKDLSMIAGIVHDGDSHFQHGTDVDRGLMGRATDLMRVSTDEQRFGQMLNDPNFALLNPLSQQLFEAGSPDHIVDSELVNAVHNPLLADMKPNEFLSYATNNHWTDGGAAVAKVFDWTGHAPSSEAQIAGATAHTYANFLGDQAKGLLDMPGHHTLGEINPKLVQGFAHGLAPYVPNIAGEHNALSQFFGDLDDAASQGNDLMPKAKGLFSVLNTDPEAAKFFDGKAYEEILRDQNSYAKGIADGLPGSVLDNTRMQEADTMRALVDVGTNNALDAKGVNTDLRAAEAYASKSAAYDMAVNVLSAGADATPAGPAGALGVEALGSALKSDIIGAAPSATAQAALYPNMTEFDADRAVLNGLHANGVAVDLPPGFIEDHATGGSHISTYAEYAAQARGQVLSEAQYNTAIRQALASIVGADNVPTVGMEKDTYNDIIKNPHPWS